jgi:hypothetical protein
MQGKMKAVGVIFLAFLAIGAGWALWMGLKVFAWIAGVALLLGVAAGVAINARSRRRIAGPGDRSRLS